MTIVKVRFLLTSFLTVMTAWAIAQPVTITPPEASIEPGGSVELTASGAIYYRWSPSAGLSVTDGPVTVASPLVTTTYTCNGFALGADNVVNGDFNQGNVGFTSDYVYNSNLWYEGTYFVDYDASLHHESFVGLGHGGTGNFMIVNGSTTPGTNVWTEQITVNPGSYYAFSTWVCTLAGQASEVAMLQFSINGTQIGEIFRAPSSYYRWEQFYVLWYSDTSTTATITILNQNTGGSGNDFGLDDISFCELELVGQPQCTVHVNDLAATATADDEELCEGSSTTLHAMVSGGMSNYTYSWTPAASLDDPTSANPVATPPAGYTTYTCHVSDGYENLDVSVMLNVHPYNDTIVVDPSICFGQTYNFHGTLYDEDGQIAYFDTIDNHGCLQVEKLILSVDEYQRPPVLTQYECYEQGTTPSWYWDRTGITYHEDTYDEIVLDDPEGGCPILYRLDLKFHESFYREENKVSCGAYYWPVNGMTYTESEDGIIATFHNTFGDIDCDSIYVLNLTVSDYETNELEAPEDETCDGYYWSTGGKEYTTDDEYDPEDHVFLLSGDYHRTYTNVMGCDSVVTMHVTINFKPEPSEIGPANPNNLYPHWVVTPTEFQINYYEYEVHDINPGCHWDTVVWSCDDAPQWNINPYGEIGEKCKVYVTNFETDTIWLTARAFNRCFSEGVETRYWLVCSFFGVEDQKESPVFSVTPNPNQGQMTLRFENLSGKINIKVYDLMGNQVDQVQTFNDLEGGALQYDMSRYSDGIYFFVVTAKEGTVTEKVIVQRK